MEVITKQSKIKNVAESWKSQYFRNGEWTKTCSGCSGIVYEKLSSLPDNCSEADIENIIGNPSWTKIGCDVCENDVQSCVVLSRDTSSSSLQVCSECLTTALNDIEMSNKG